MKNVLTTHEIADGHYIEAKGTHDREKEKGLLNCNTKWVKVDTIIDSLEFIKHKIHHNDYELCDGCKQEIGAWYIISVEQVCDYIDELKNILLDKTKCKKTLQGGLKKMNFTLYKNRKRGMSILIEDGYELKDYGLSPSEWFIN